MWRAGPGGTIPGMLITRHNAIADETAPGWRATRLADARHGAGVFEVWSWVLNAGAGSPSMQCPTHLVVLVMAGSGKLQLPSGPYCFRAPCTIALAPGWQHQLFNDGTRDLRLIAIRALVPDFPAPTDDGPVVTVAPQ